MYSSFRGCGAHHQKRSAKRSRPVRSPEPSEFGSHDIRRPDSMLQLQATGELTRNNWFVIFPLALYRVTNHCESGICGKKANAELVIENAKGRYGGDRVGKKACRAHISSYSSLAKMSHLMTPIKFWEKNRPPAVCWSVFLSSLSVGRDAHECNRARKCCSVPSARISWESSSFYLLQLQWSYLAC